tara:strand:+ start:394 stop:1068 length:675 start_codon:yes stop_codon:yes gene_type:complete
MEISANTVNILKNFASINSNIVIKPGQKLMTISEAKNILAQASIPEEFGTQVGIYDLQEFLNVLNLVDTPNIQLDQSYMHVRSQSGRELVKYYYADTEMLTSPTKPIEMPDPDVSFNLDVNTLSSLKRASGIFGHGQLLIEPSEGCIKLSVVDPENATANTYSIEVDGEYTSAPFKFVLNISNLRMVSDDYKVKISKKLISEFTNEASNLTYWIALEKSSKYGE